MDFLAVDVWSPEFVVATDSSTDAEKLEGLSLKNFHVDLLLLLDLAIKLEI